MNKWYDNKYFWLVMIFINAAILFFDIMCGKAMVAIMICIAALIISIDQYLTYLK